MPGRKKKAKSKFLGTRSFGGGNKKTRRGGGTRGGRGKSGRGKHKFSYVTAYEQGYFGKHGFVRHSSKFKTDDVPVAHLYDITTKAARGELEKKDGRYHYDFKGKILATGHITIPVVVKAFSWSKKAEERIKAAGGELLKLE
jgi:large subunit ribosomal protein L15